MLVGPVSEPSRREAVQPEVRENVWVGTCVRLRCLDESDRFCVQAGVPGQMFVQGEKALGRGLDRDYIGAR